MKAAYLHLAGGSTFSGQAPEWFKEFSGEVVFNTGMTGYEQSLTDPSYAGQILVFTYPLIGNYGVAGSGVWESSEIQAAGAIVSEASDIWSHYGAKRSFGDWLKEQGAGLMTAVDTRALTLQIRNSGSLPGSVSRKKDWQSPSAIDIPFVSIRQPEYHGQKSGKRVILVDCGAKLNIRRSLVAMGLSVKQVPYDYDYNDEDFQGVVLSNGPGDPASYKITVEILKKALTRRKPIFGICLGSQLMALAAGASTYKLKFGHRGHNQPCVDTADNRCYMTSQNHGYAVEEKSLPAGWRVNFRNLNDGSVEGVAHKTKPFFSVQFHPEASPGPTDTAWLFQKFGAML